MSFTHNDDAGGLTIGAVDMFGIAWEIRDLYKLWMPADQRGSDVLLPGVAGMLARKRRPTATTHILELKINGAITSAGVTSGSTFSKLYTNLVYLNTNVVAPTGTTDGTRSAVLTVPGGATFTEPIHVLGLEPVDVVANGAWMLAELEISIPSGRFQ